MQALHQEPHAAVREQPGYSGARMAASVPEDHSPTTPVPKNVAFELLLDENSKVRARIPMRVQIYPHDTTDSIVTTVKNFYGIYDGAASGVSFEDENGITLIARYENLRNNMTVYVRVIPIQTYGENYGDHGYGSFPAEARRQPSLGEPFQMAQPMPSLSGLEHGPVPSRPTSRVARKRSTSPSSRSRRSASQNKQTSRSGLKSRGSSTHASLRDDDTAGYSDSDGGYGSVNGTRKARSEQFASSEISMDNILQDGRRKRPKFDSSELPLFVPPQVPLTTSTSSISPQRRSIGQDGAVSPFARPMPRQYNFQQPLPSPQSYGHQDPGYGSHAAVNTIYATPAVPEHGHHLRDRSGAQFLRQMGHPMGRVSGPGVLPTPDPTIASCISDEDVAMQLIRLGDASNFSHGRTSASTLDDAFSGVADAASSTGPTSDGEDYTEDDEEEVDPAFKSRHKLESSPMMPPGTVKRHHKRLDEILPSFDSTDVSGDDVDEDYRHDGPNGRLVKNEDDTFDAETTPQPKKVKTQAATSAPPTKARPHKGTAVKMTNKGSKSMSASGAARKIKAVAPLMGGNHKVAMSTTTSGISPAVAPTRKVSSGTSVNLPQPQTLGADEEDLSSKPRCQRCRKSKKGCDRERPCGRCKDAGIGIEGCISEDEGNGRKGRYGRHMGVPVKKSLDDLAADTDASVAVAGVPIVNHSVVDKNKKRKR